MNQTKAKNELKFGCAKTVATLNTKLTVVINWVVCGEAIRVAGAKSIKTPMNTGQNFHQSSFPATSGSTPNKKEIANEYGHIMKSDRSPSFLKNHENQLKPWRLWGTFSTQERSRLWHR